MIKYSFVLYFFENIFFCKKSAGDGPLFSQNGYGLPGRNPYRNFRLCRSVIGTCCQGYFFGASLPVCFLLFIDALLRNCGLFFPLRVVPHKEQKPHGAGEASVAGHNPETFQKRLKALEKKRAEKGLVLRESQLTALEKAREAKQASGEIENRHPGYPGVQGTRCAGTIKSVGRIYQQTFVATYTNSGCR